MAPKKTMVVAQSSAADVTRSNTMSQDGSQDTQNDHMYDLMKKARQRTKERKQKRKDEILNAHNQRTEQLHTDIKKCVDERNERVRAIRRPKVERLLELERQKKGLDRQVENIEAELRRGYLSTARQLELAIKDRREGLSA